MNLFRKLIVVCGLFGVFGIPIVASADNSHLIQTDNTSLLKQVEDTRKKLMGKYNTFQQVMLLIDKNNPIMNAPVNAPVYYPLWRKVWNQAENTINHVNSSTWLNEIQPELNRSLQDLLNYDSTFDSLGNTILQAHADKNSKQVLQLLKQLQNDVTNKQAPILAGLKKFKNYQDGVMDNTNKLNEVLQEVKAVIQTNGATEAELRKIRSIDNDLSIFIDDLSTENGWNTSVQGISNNWTILNMKIDSLITKIETAPDQVDSAYLSSELNSIKNAWSDTYAQALRIL